MKAKSWLTRVLHVRLLASDMLTKRNLLLLSLTIGLPSPGAEPYGAGRPLTLAYALALTLQHSPDLSAFSWEIRSAEARILQAKLIPNPEVSLEGENLTKPGSSQNNNEIGRAHV